MGSDGFESKRLGGLGPVELSGARGHDRQTQPDALADIGDVAAANLVEISGVIDDSVYLPEGGRSLAAEGQIATAGETVLADLASAETARSYRIA